MNAQHTPGPTLAGEAGSAPVVDDLMQKMRNEAAKIMNLDATLGIEPVSQDLAEIIAWNRIQRGFENREIATAIRVVLQFCVEPGTGIWALLDEARHRLELTPSAMRPLSHSPPYSKINPSEASSAAVIPKETKQ